MMDKPRTLKDDLKRLEDWLTVGGEYPLEELLKVAAGFAVLLAGSELLVLGLQLLAG